MRIALANVRPPSSREESLEIVLQTMEQAKQENAELICFPECFVPIYRTSSTVTPIDQTWLNEAWTTIDERAAKLGLAVILGTERLDGDALFITVRVTNQDGSCAGFQDKVQLDPSEEEIYTPGDKRRTFQCGDITFGIVICHEGWRYPETVRWAARKGAHVVFHPHFEIPEDLDFLPSQFADPANTFHEKAALSRAAENACYFATVNCALAGATTTSAIIDPNGISIAHQPYGKEGLLFGEIEPEKATRFLAERFKPGGVDLP